jgi:hypothetical protein
MLHNKVDLAQLRKEHRDLIRGEVKEQIADAVDAFQDRDLEKSRTGQKTGGIAGALITTIIAMVAITLGASAAGVTVSKQSPNTLTFDDCLFRFLHAESPGPEIQKLTKLVLTQNTPAIKLPIGE